jgi:hypothetical protein
MCCERLEQVQSLVAVEVARDYLQMSFLPVPSSEVTAASLDCHLESTAGGSGVSMLAYRLSYPCSDSSET